jgi:transcriptional regulator with XRE-family HTH domain
VKLLNRRLRDLRLNLGISQEALGAQGFVSTPGWAKIENGSRQPSDALLEKLVVWLEKDRYVTKREGKPLLEELLTLKYMGHLSPFVRHLARLHYEELKESSSVLKVAEEPK